MIKIAFLSDDGLGVDVKYQTWMRFSEIGVAKLTT